LLELLNQMDGFDQGSNVKVSLTSHKRFCRLCYR
jgi:ATP-dependent 26S proteasome regulatory subunit